MTAYLALIVLIIGLIVYMLPINAKVNEAGRIAYAFGLLVMLLQFATKIVHLP